jgi:hypothetical protein
LRFLPLSGISFFAAAASGRMTAKLPARVLMGTGMTLVTVGLALMLRVEVDSEWTALVPGFLVGGIGIGMVNPSLASTAVAVVEVARSGMASGINSTFRQVGIATGIAGLGAIFRSSAESEMIDSFKGVVDIETARSIAEAIASGGNMSAPGLEIGQAEKLSNFIDLSFVSALHSALQVAVAVAAIGAFAGWLMIRESDMATSPLDH